ncbi:50S ribosomal protein L3 [Nitrosomonas sp. HPC101]|uniref:50S ribosomal protein L3 n=1 Tax=Nitrosomonas sp. HPC101 TaxID=1658667 RepID=UPI00136EF233|nr:50S ribosomal protein L3 [Nitrosomonas sp. HPC101]MXS84979.1 50S ribosomal protein L3 [Nitrosomonas sp. HPC101]
MKLGLIGKKIGMTRIFTESGSSIPVTVLDVSKNRVVQIKTVEKDGYSAIQLTQGYRRKNRMTKALSGHFAQAGVEAGKVVKEFKVEPAINSDIRLGAEINVEIFQIGSKVDVSGVSIGKGYAGTIKRHNFSSSRASHGNSRSHKVPGSIGMAQDPGRVFPGKKMTGRLGGVNSTIQNIEIVRVDTDRSLIFLKGSVPGPKGNGVFIRPSVKHTIKQ